MKAEKNKISIERAKLKEEVAQKRLQLKEDLARERMLAKANKALKKRAQDSKLKDRCLARTRNSMRLFMQDLI
jgi:hypothetical protein